ncbi:hypothetical protein H311_04555, partial [Anncaliia algerae PRA109]
KSVNKESLSNFIGDYNENKLNEYILSQEELPNNDSLPVKRITFNNSEKYLKDPSKDKFVIFEAPWCQYCKLLKPIVNDLAEIYKDNANILVGTYDMTENDPLKDYHIRGYPTLFLIKGETNEIKQYTQKERDLKSLADFIKNEGHYKVDITEQIKLLGDSKEKIDESKESLDKPKESVDDNKESIDSKNESDETNSEDIYESSYEDDKENEFSDIIDDGISYEGFSEEVREDL